MIRRLRYLRPAIQLLPFLLAVSAAAQDLKLPNKPGSIKFLVIGDTGTGGSRQYEIGALAAKYREKFPFTFAVMMGDNIYGSDSPNDFVKKFEKPYEKLLSAGVKFYASLGNHDNPNQRFYKLFNMNGERYYSFVPAPGVKFFALDTTYFDQRQFVWIEKELQKPAFGWKICFFHHPLYSGGKKHGPDMEWRGLLEPMFVKYGVNPVLSGHEHFYQRIKPQKGIVYWIVGSSAKLREGNVEVSDQSEKAFDTDNVFMIVEIIGDELHFQTISRADKTVDSGMIRKDKPPSRLEPGPAGVLEIKKSVP